MTSNRCLCCCPGHRAAGDQSEREKKDKTTKHVEYLLKIKKISTEKQVQQKLKFKPATNSVTIEELESLTTK